MKSQVIMAIGLQELEKLCNFCFDCHPICEYMLKLVSCFHDSKHMGSATDQSPLDN